MSRFDAGLVARAMAAVLGRQQANATRPAEAPGPAKEAVQVEAEGQDLRDLAAELTKRLCRRFEGLRLKAYLCPAGVWTIGYGATTYLDGRAVKPTDPPISAETAERLLDRQVRGTYMPATQALCPTARAPGTLGALTDFCFNLGPTRLKASTLRKRVLEEDWDGACDELAKWVYGGGRRLPGLVLRCQARIEMVRSASGVGA